MCICINCRHIHKCKTYKFIENQHSIKNINNQVINFTPVNTIVIVKINKQQKNITLDWDLRECSSFIEQPGCWLR